MNDLIRRSDATALAIKLASSKWKASYIRALFDSLHAIEPNLLIVPETIERGCETYIGENIVVVHHDDFIDMKVKAMLYDEMKGTDNEQSSN